MKVYKNGKFHFNNAKKLIDTAADRGELLRQFAFPKATKLKIELLEISIGNPSDIKIEIVVDDSDAKRKRTINLYKYRSRFISQNGILILDTSNIEEFSFGFSNPIFKIKVESEGDFDFLVYYSTDQQEDVYGYEEL